MSRIKVLLLVLTIIVLGLIAVNVNAQAPIITTQPNQIIKCTGNTSSMTVVATGTEPLHYQWYQDGAPVGTDSPTLDFPSLAPADEGTYICNVSNGEGDIDTDPRDVIVVETAPSVTDVTSENDLVCIGADNMIEVTYDGEYASVTWYVLSDIVGYTTQIQITNAQLEDEGAYYCMVTNVCGQDISETVSIDIVEPVNITTQPATQTICEGEDATFSTTSEGDYINYLWLADESMMVGETDPSLTITAPSYPHSIEYKMVAYNVCNNDTSNGVYVNINTFPEITGQPIDMQECDGNDVTLYAFATGTTESFYQWYDENNDPITDETNTSLIVDLLSNDTAYYYCEITNICGTVYTDTSEVITLMPPIVTQQPVGATLCVGDNITIQAKASGTDPLSYQWLFEGSDVVGGNISGDESQNMTITSITA